jgi:hypothetical protein
LKSHKNSFLFHNVVHTNLSDKSSSRDDCKSKLVVGKDY